MGTQGDKRALSIAVVGHKGAGKSALVAALGYVAKATPQLGKPGAWGLGLDDTVEEKEQASTYETHLVSFSWGEARLQLLDTPGEVGFFADTQLAFMAADAVLLVVSARAGVQATTHRLIRMILEANKPCFIAISRCDEEQIQVETVVEELRALKEPITLVEVPHHRGKREALDGVVSVTSMKAWIGHPEGPNQIAPDPIPSDAAEEVRAAREQAVDDVACTDDELADHYLQAGDLTPAELSLGEHRAVAQAKLVPVLFTSASVPFGIVALLDALVEFAPTPEERPPLLGQQEGKAVSCSPSPDAPLCAFVFKTKIDAYGKSSLVRVVSGTLSADSHVVCAETGATERIGAFSSAPGEARNRTSALPGELVVLSKLKQVTTRSTLCSETHVVALDFPARPPTLFSRAVVVPNGRASSKVAEALHAIAEEDPGLSVSVDSDSHELTISGLGAAHLDITLERLKRRSKLELSLGPPHIDYKETITESVKNVEGRQKKQTGGHGQFGIVYLDVEPLARGEGFVFEDRVVGGSVPRQYIGSVKQGVERALAQGIILGYPVVDVKVSLVDGKHHSVDSSDAAFQTAGFRGFLAAARAAKPALLEPVAKLALTVPLTSVGDVLGAIAQHRGSILGQNVDADESTIDAFLPFAELVNFEPVLSAYTQGRGSFEFTFDHYDQVSAAAQADLIAKSGFCAELEDE